MQEENIYNHLKGQIKVFYKAQFSFRILVNQKEKELFLKFKKKKEKEKLSLVTGQGSNGTREAFH